MVKRWFWYDIYQRDSFAALQIPEENKSEGCIKNEIKKKREREIYLQ